MYTPSRASRALASPSGKFLERYYFLLHFVFKIFPFIKFLKFVEREMLLGERGNRYMRPKTIYICLDTCAHFSLWLSIRGTHSHTYTNTHTHTNWVYVHMFCVMAMFDAQGPQCQISKQECDLAKKQTKFWLWKPGCCFFRFFDFSIFWFFDFIFIF